MVRFGGIIPRAAVVAAVASLGALTAAPASAETTFADVLARPSDLALNYAFAQDRIAAGDLSGAAGALERILFSAPDWDQARLLYAAVLERMDDPVAARRELRVLEGRPLPPDLAADVERRARRLDGGAAPVAFSGELQLGLGYDDNAAGLTSDVFVSPFGPPTDTDEGAASGIIAAAGRATFAIDRARDLDAFVDAHAAHKGFFDSEALDQGHVGLGLGLQARAAAVVLSSELFGGLGLLDGDTHKEEVGLRFGATAALTPKVDLRGALSWADQTFDDVADSAGEADRSGERWDVRVGLDVRASVRQSFGFGVGYTDKSANIEPYAYSGWAVDARYTKVLTDAGLGFTATVNYADLEFDGPDPFVFTLKDRADERLAVRAALSAPIDVLFPGALGTALGERARIVAGLSHVDRSSNIDIFSTENTGADVRIVWEFGK